MFVVDAAKLAFLLVLPLTALPQAEQTPSQTATRSVEGVILILGAAEPIAGVEVTLTQGITATLGRGFAGRGGSGAQRAFTDADGKFTLRGLKAGSYRLIAAANGYVRQEFPPGTPLVVTAEEDVKGLTIRLAPTGSVSGVIQNSSGEPLPGVSVSLLRRATACGKSTLQEVASARTNDLGEYRMYWIVPGNYVVRAGGKAPGMGPGSEAAAFHEAVFEGNNEVVDSYSYTFWPGATEEGGAREVTISSGSELPAIGFTLTRQPLYRVRGRVVDAVKGRPPRGVDVSVTSGAGATQARRTDDSALGFSSKYNAVDGSLEIAAFLPGTYVLTVIARAGADRSRQFPLQLAEPEPPPAAIAIPPPPPPPVVIPPPPPRPPPTLGGSRGGDPRTGARGALEAGAAPPPPPRWPAVTVTVTNSDVDGLLWTIGSPNAP